MNFKPFKAAAIQLASGSNVAANLSQTEKLIQEAAARQADLVVLPENFGFMGQDISDLCSISEPAGQGPLQDFLAQMAQRHQIWLVGGTVPLQTSDPERVYAASLVFDDQGRQVARYDKIHLFDVDIPETGEHYCESLSIQAGQQVVVVDAPFGKLGLAICYDLRFPELFRAMLERGVQTILLPAAFTAMTGKAHWESLVRARAIENLVYLVAAGQGGFHVNGRETHGHSMVVDPWGVVLAEQARGNGVVVAEIDPEYQSNLRRSFPAIEHRRLSSPMDW